MGVYKHNLEVSTVAGVVLVWTILFFLIFSPLCALSSGDQLAPKDSQELPPLNPESFFTPEERAWIEANPIIKITSDSDYAPAEFYENGEFKGITVDYFKEISAYYGLRFEYLTYDTWSDVLNAAKRGEVHLITAAVQTEERSQYLSFTKSYLSMPTYFYIKKGAPQIGDLKSTEGKRLATIKGYSSADFLTLVAPEAELVQVQNIADGLTRLMRGEVDAFIGDAWQVAYYSQQMGFTEIERDVSVDYDFPFKLGVGVKKTEPILYDIMSKIVAHYPSSRLERIKQNWIEVDEPLMPTNYTLIVVLGGALIFSLLVVVVVLLWNRTLKQKVAAQTAQLHIELEKTRVYDRQMRLIIDAIPYPLFTKDSRYHFVTVNEAYARFFGSTVADIEGVYDQEVYSRNRNTDISKFRVLEKEVFANREETHIKDYELVDADGAMHIYDIKKVPYPMIDSDQWGMLGISVDITALKQKERERFMALNHLVANVAHQINTPLGNIISAMSYLNIAQEEVKERISRGQFSSEELRQFIETIADVSAINVKGMNRIKSVVDAFESLSMTSEASTATKINLYDQVSILASNKKAAVYFDHGIHFDPSLTLYTYQGALEEVLTRVMDNAIQHGFKSGDFTQQQILMGNRLDFYGQDAGDHFILSVCDNGPGIPEAYISKVQDPLFSSTLHLGSLGIGLSIATNLAQEVLGGRLYIENRPSGGVQVSIYIKKLKP